MKLARPTVYCLAALALVPVAAPVLCAAPPAYYPSALITLPNSTQASLPVARGMNDQGYVVIEDTGQARAPMVYFNGTLYPLSQNTTDAGSLGATTISNVAADGSFKVGGSFVDTTDGLTHPCVWTVQSNGTSSDPLVLRNLVLPPDSQHPGEQGDAFVTAVNSSGLVVGGGQSYLLTVPLEWAPGSTTASNAPGFGYGNVDDVDDAGDLIGIASPDDQQQVPTYLSAGGAATTLPIPSSTGYLALKALRGNLIVGTHPETAVVADTGGAHAFVYDLSTGVTTDLPAVGPGEHDTSPYYNDEADRVNAAGDIVGLAGGSLIGTLWKRDPAAGSYTAYRLDIDLAPLAENGTNVFFNGGDSDNALTGIAADGTLAISYVQSYDPVLGYQNGIMLMKPGVDPRPVINPSDPTMPGSVMIHTEPGQAFTYQLTATNNPTAFTLTGEDESGSSALPAGVSFNPTTGILSGTGPATGLYSFAATATNGLGYGAFSAGVELSSGDAPTVSDQAASANLNQAFTYQVVVAPAGSSVSLNGTYPTGVSFDPTTGILSGTPTQSGAFPLTIYANNAIGQSSATLTLTVSDIPPAAFSVSLVKPANNVSVIAGGPLVAKAKVDLTNAGSETVASIAFLLDGQPIGNTLASKPYKESLALDPSLSGTHTLTAVATANDGHVATSAPVTITVVPSFVDLTGSTSFVPKYNQADKLVVKGNYSLTNLGNAPAGLFPIKFYLSDDATFDPSDTELDALVASVIGKDPGFDKVIPGIPANTTLSTTDPGSTLPTIKVSIPHADVTLLGLSGKYILAVIDPDNTVGEAAGTRANNVLAFLIP